MHAFCSTNDGIDRTKTRICTIARVARRNLDCSYVYHVDDGENQHVAERDEVGASLNGAEDRPETGPQSFVSGMQGSLGEGGNGAQQGDGGGTPSPPPTISLPKGGGAIRGMGEKFVANPVTGTGSMTIPIAVSPGRSGLSSQLSLTYDSGASNGAFSFGWSLSVAPTTGRPTRPCHGATTRMSRTCPSSPARAREACCRCTNDGIDAHEQ